MFGICINRMLWQKSRKKYYDDVMAAVNNASTANSTLITDLQTFLSDVTNEDARNRNS